MELIDKSAIVAAINKRIQELHPTNTHKMQVGEKVDRDVLMWLNALTWVKGFLDTLETKEDGNNYLEKFKSLQHITGDLHKTLEDWGYAPNLYYFDEMWHVSWISCEEGDSIKDFEGNSPEEAINKACNWFHSTFCNG